MSRGLDEVWLSLMMIVVLFAVLSVELFGLTEMLVPFDWRG